MLEVQIGLTAAAWLVADLNEVAFGPSEVVTIAGQAELVDSGRVEGVDVGRAGLVALELVFVGRWLVAAAAAAAAAAVDVDVDVSVVAAAAAAAAVVVEVDGFGFGVAVAAAAAAG